MSTRPVETETGIEAETDAESGRAGRPVSWRRELAALAACAAVGLVLSVLPHLVWWPTLGEPVWVADFDDLSVYLAAGAQAYDNHPFRLGDPPFASGASGMFPWVQFVPGVLVARALRLGPLGVNLVWRVFAGLGMAAGWYLLIRRYVAGPWAAAGLTCLMLSNCGLYSGLPFVKHFWLAAKVAAGRAGLELSTLPLLCFQWRIITPGLNFPFLLLHLALFARARDHPGRLATALSGASFGLLFYAYFYYWTAAGLALVVVMLMDGRSRRPAFHTGWVGGLIGLPSVLAGAALKRSTSPDWLERSDKFLPVARFSELSLHPSLLVLAAALVWVLLRRRDLSYLWATALAGGLLMNHQAATGLQIENFHWLYVRGPCLTLLVLLLVWGALWTRPAWRGPLAWGLAAACLAQVGTCAWMRAVEATQTRITRSIMADYQNYRAQRLRPGVARLAPNAVVAGAPAFVNFAAVLENARPLDHFSVLFSPGVDNADWDARIALNAYLLGQGREAFRARQEELLRSDDQETAGFGGARGPWVRDPARLAARVSSRVAAFDAVAADLPAALDRYRVRYVAVPTGQAPPPAAPGVSWAPAQRGPTWDLYERPAP